RVSLTSPSFPFPPSSTAVVFTLSLHDALPIFCLGQVLGELQILRQRFFRHGWALQQVRHGLLQDIGKLHIGIRPWGIPRWLRIRSEEHTSELQSRFDLVCRLLLEKNSHNKRKL